SQSNLGYMYDHGRGVVQDSKEAFKWYMIAAEQGDANSQFNVGSMYALGRGVKQSWPQAYFWALLAARDGEKDSAKQQEIIAKKLKPAQRAKIQQQVLEWKPKAGNS
ncbi:MAG: tetratricopeptide repeat protein, partial [Comamonas sp.]